MKVILQLYSVKALLTFDNNSNSRTSVTLTINNSLVTKELKQDSIPFRKGIYVLVLVR